MFYRDETTGNYISVSIKALDGMPIGSIIQFAGEDIPTGWLVCDGDVVSSTDYPDLFAEIGNKYGGTSPSFKLPDLRGRVPVGLDPTDQLEEFDTLGNSGGERTHTLTSSENAKINLLLGASNQSSTWANRAFYEGMVPVYHDAGNQYWDADLENKVQPHNNLQPYLVVNFIIKAKNSTPTMASVVNATNNSTEDAYSCDYINDNYFSYKVLWENPNPTSAFASQSITLNSGDYTYYEIIYKDNPSGTRALSTGKVPKGLGARMQLCGGWGGTHLTTDRREASYIDETTLGIPSCITYDQSGGSTSYGTNNDSIIPIQVIGYK